MGFILKFPWDYACYPFLNCGYSLSSKFIFEYIEFRL